MDHDHKTILLRAGWHFSESSRQAGVSQYILMSPTGMAGSEEIHESELQTLETELRLDALRDQAADDNVRVLQGIARVLGLPDFTDVTPEIVAAAMQDKPVEAP